MENQQHLQRAFTGRLVPRISVSRRISPVLMVLTLSVRWAGAQSSPDDTVGTPWTGKAGVRETTAQIMAREAALASQPTGRVRVIKPRFVRTGNNLPENPASSLTSHWPRSEKTAASIPATSQAGPFAPQTVGTSFLGAQLSDTIGYVPPDSMADVGSNQIVVCVNGRIRTFNKNGVADGALDTTTDNFFASVLGGSSTSDPRVRFDRLSGHWFITMITVNTPNFVLIAVSSGPTITSASSFTFFSFQADSKNFGDYDTLGVDANALYIGVNVFSGNTFVNTTGFVVKKANLLGGTLTVTTFTSLISGRGSSKHGPFTPQGVNNDDPAATQGYFIGVDATSFGTLVVRRISNPGGTPSISANILVTVPATGNPLGGVPALGSSQGLDDLDDRLFATRMHKGNLWTAHNIEVDATGTANSSGGRDGSRWYELTNLTGTPTLVQSGTLFDPAASNPRSFWIPSCAMSGQGHMALGCSVAGNNQYAEIATAGRFATDPAGTLQSPTTAVTSSSTYNIGSQNNRYRWGDFSVTSVDPDDDMTLWTVQEYCNANNSWGVQVIKLLAPPPATPVGSSPSTVTQGVANVSVIITGLAAAGDGFFDPGTNFPNHISATVNGGGVTVDNLVYNNPTNITAHLTIAGNAGAGARTITVTNPDGQSATSATGILTVATVVSPTNQPPTLAPIPSQSVTAGTTLTVTNVATDPDGDKLTFSLESGAATNATINATNGIFSWTPMQSQAGTNQFSVIATDNGSPPLSATQTFAVTVIATNTPPTLAPIADRIIHTLMTMTITNSASDPDIGETLTFSLDPGAPAGASIGATNGVFAWTPAGSQIGTNDVTVRVTDDGLPPLSATQSFAVVVMPRPVLTIGVTNGIVTLTWSAISGLTYQPQFNTNLTNALWTAFPSNVVATGPTANATDSNDTNTGQYYRIFVVP
jgi:Putative Ig domain